MSKSISPAFDTPKSCDECDFCKNVMTTNYQDETICAINDMNIEYSDDFNPYDFIHPQCPLQDATELLEIINSTEVDLLNICFDIFTTTDEAEFVEYEFMTLSQQMELMGQIKQKLNKLYKALGGKQ